MRNLRSSFGGAGLLGPTPSAPTRFGFALLVILWPAAGAAWVAAPFAPPSAPVAAPAATTSAPATPDDSAAASAAHLLKDGDIAVEVGNLEEASVLYERLLREYPNASEGDAARRALRIISASVRSARAAAIKESGLPGIKRRPAGFGAKLRNPAAPGGDSLSTDDESQDDVVMREEPYSLRTSERLRLTSWEKLDFGVTAFLYGLSVGFFYALSADPNLNEDTSATPLAIGALSYTLGAVLYLRLAEPDRGDLPLALAITSYMPTTVLLVANFASDHPATKNTSLAVAAAGVLSVPFAVAVTRKLDLDPGDTQLVRDAGFWGLSLATAATMGFGGDTQNFGGLTSYHSPSQKAVAGLGLLGLYGGLGLGILAAANSEITLERVRVTTWGGYGGAFLGLLAGLGMKDQNLSGDQAAYRGLAIGALAGLVITFASTGGLDGIPAGDTPENKRAGASRLTPSLLSLDGTAGQAHPGFGLTYVMP